jgi:uncharacterized membrane protein
MDEIETLITLAGLALLLIIFVVPYLFFSHLGLKRRVRDLDQMVQRLQSNPQAPPQAAAQYARPDLRRPDAPPQPATDAPIASPWPAATIASPWPAATIKDGPAVTSTEKPNAAPTDTAPAAYVFKHSLITTLAAWLRDNWVLAVAAASLGFAGLFMVQYGIENGVLTPFWRVMGALAFGAALIGGGEYIRRKGGDDMEDGDAVGATRHLPSTLSGAGIIVLYIAVFSARALYGLTGPLTTLIGLAGVSTIAMVLGWFYGPMLAAVGILGATVAPFLVGGGSDNGWMVHYYLAFVAIAALGVDTIKRWAWVSAFGLMATLGGNALLYSAQGADLHFITAMLVIAFAAFTIPERSLTPRQSGAALLDMITRYPAPRPAFPTRLTLGATLAATLAAMVVAQDAATPDAVWLALGALLLMTVTLTLWTRHAPALYDHALIPGIGFLVALAVQSVNFGPLFMAFQAAVPVPNGPETDIPPTIWVLTALAAASSVMMFARMQWSVRGQPQSATFWALAAAVFAPATVLILEFLWMPGDVVGPYPWALAVIAMAVLMTALAMRTPAPDADAPLRTGLFAVGALTLITLAFFLVMTKAALTVALAVMVLGTAYLDRRTPLPPLAYFIQIAVAIITFRLVVWPGLPWALDAGWDGSMDKTPYPEVAFAYAAPLALMAAAWAITRGHSAKTAIALESAIWTIAGIFAMVTLIRAVPDTSSDNHFMLGLVGTIWLALALGQLYRMQTGSGFGRFVRGCLATLYALTALVPIAALLTLFSPLNRLGGRVLGPPVFDSLALAYLPLAAAFAIGAWKIPQSRRRKIGFILGSCLFAALYVGMEIRRIWRGTALWVPGFTDAELYSYTLAMLIVAVGLLMLAFSKRSDTLRKVAMAGVALTIAKVFLVDTSGLSGLIRVMSFMGLGLSLVALAWLNRKMTAQWDRDLDGGDGTGAVGSTHPTPDGPDAPKT